MDTRKIQTVGGGTYTVSLPKEWAESENCTAGTTVNLHTHIDGLLVIQTPESQTTARNRVELEAGTDDPAEIEQLLRAAYAAGVESVVLEVPDGYTDEQLRAIERVTRNLTGVTVAEETETQVTVQTLLDAGEVSVRQSVRQLQFVALSMHRDAMAALTTGTTSDRWADRDEQADRLHAMIDRYFERGLARLDEIDALGLTRPELFSLWRPPTNSNAWPTTPSESGPSPTSSTASQGGPSSQPSKVSLRRSEPSSKTLSASSSVTPASLPLDRRWPRAGPSASG